MIIFEAEQNDIIASFGSLFKELMLSYHISWITPNIIITSLLDNCYLLFWLNLYTVTQLTATSRDCVKYKPLQELFYEIADYV